MDLYIIPLCTEITCLKRATDLRSEGVKTDVEMTGRKLRKSLDSANKQGIPYEVILGENELKEGKIMLKDMLKGCEYETSLRELEQACFR